MRCPNTNPNPKLELNVTFDPKGDKKQHASHYGAHLATYEQLAQYSTCTCGPDLLLLALVVFFHSQLAYLLYSTCGGPIVTCAGGLFSLPTSAFTLLPHVVVLLLLAPCGGGGGGMYVIYTAA